MLMNAWLVNAPIIVAEEYRTLAPFIDLLEKMGSLYTQHFSKPSANRAVQNSFEVFYEGNLASANTTKPLFAALVKGLLTPITTAETLNINIVNAELVARERGIMVNESKSRDEVEGEGYASSVTLRSRTVPRSPSTSRTKQGVPTRQASETVISGFVTNNTPYISRLGRFRTSFIPHGTLLICRNYDEPGKIGVVGGVLGKAGVNIKFMSVAPVDRSSEGQTPEARSVSNGSTAPSNGDNEALMILGLDRLPDEAVLRELSAVEGVLEASVVELA